MLVGPRSVEIVEEPVPYRPRPAKLRALRLKDEFDRRLGDANIGGAAATPVVTAYRQDALRCARVLARGGPMRVLASITLALITVAFFGGELLDPIGVPGIWFPFGIGVSRTQYVYAIIIPLLGFLIVRTLTSKNTR